MIATLEREVPALLKEDDPFFVEFPDQMWDGHGMLVAMIVMMGLWAVSSVAIVAIDYYTPKKQAATSAMLMIAEPTMMTSAAPGQTTGQER